MTKKNFCRQFLICLFLYFATFQCLINADEVRPAYLQITEVAVTETGSQWDILWKQPTVENKRLPIKPVFPESCQLANKFIPAVKPGALVHYWTTECDLSKGVIVIDGLSVTLTDVMVRISRLSGDSVNYLLRAKEPSLDLGSVTATTANYLNVGFEHLLLSVDHILFVIGLVLLVSNRWALLKTITAFTLAHSITLALSVFGWVQLEQGPIEAVIALSIVFLARELVQAKEQRSQLVLGRPWIMAFIFGLLHGLGFAAAVTEIGLPADSIWFSLLLFNVGIELGQLVVVVGVLIAGRILSYFFNTNMITRAGAYGMGCAAALWTINRTLVLL